MLFPAALVAALLAAYFQFYVKPVLIIAGYNRVLQPVGNDNCHTVPDLNACESMLLFAVCCPKLTPRRACYTSAHRCSLLGLLNTCKPLPVDSSQRSFE